MATFFIQTDKDFYFSGETVSGNVFVNVVAMIVGAQGLSLKFTGYQCVKWVQAKELHRPAPPRHRPGHPPPPPPFDPIAAIPPHELVHSDNLGISDCQSEDNMDFSNRRAKFIRTSANRYYRMTYYQTRNQFTRSKVMIYQCSGFPPGQYSFPFSFKSFEGWPASFNYHTPTKKGVISYHMTAAIEPLGPNFKLQGGRQMILRETRPVQGHVKQSNGQITSCCCISKGITTSRMSFAKDGFMPGQLVQMIIEVDNSQCTANITTISISVTNRVTLRSGQGASTADSRTLFTKTVNGVPAGVSYVGEKAIREQFQMPKGPQIKPTCSGTLLSSSYHLSIMLNHDINCKCCSKFIGAGIGIIIFPFIPIYQMPSLFQQNWTPKLMPITNMSLTNTFTNPNLNNMNAMEMGFPPM